MGRQTTVDQHRAAAPKGTSTRRDTAVRMAGNRVQTAVWRLVHPVTGRTVTLFGTMHIGNAAYFRRLSSLLADLAAAGAEGDVVLKGAIGAVLCRAPADPTPPQCPASRTRPAPARRCGMRPAG